jgi:hypothetical protein
MHGAIVYCLASMCCVGNGRDVRSIVRRTDRQPDIVRASTKPLGTIIDFVKSLRSSVS